MAKIRLLALYLRTAISPTLAAHILANIGVPIKIKGALNFSYDWECFHKKLKELEF
jgi:hypothetical protein